MRVVSNMKKTVCMCEFIRSRVADAGRVVIPGEPRKEPGGKRVATVLSQSMMSTANLTDIVCKAIADCPMVESNSVLSQTEMEFLAVCFTLEPDRRNSDTKATQGLCPCREGRSPATPSD
jgi:hypothetical protein